MNTILRHLPYFEGVYHTQMIGTYSNVNARLVHMVHTMELSTSEYTNVDPPFLKIALHRSFCYNDYIFLVELRFVVDLIFYSL